MDMFGEARRERVRELYTADVPRKEICAELGLTDNELTHICNRGKIRRPEKPRTWDQCRITALFKYLAMKLSAGQIAQRLGLTRNAVIGRCTRQGLKFTQPPNCSAEVKQAAEERAKLKRQQQLDEAKAKVPPPMPRYEPPPVPAPTSTAILFIHAGPDQCRFPLWGGSAKTGKVCGAPVKKGTSWCPECFKRVRIR